MPTRRAFLKQVAIATTLRNISVADAVPASVGHLSLAGGARRIPHTDLMISRFGCACSGLVAWDRAPLSAADIATASHLVHAACDSGITLFDHADPYAFGKAEAVFGEVLKQSPDLRDRLVIQSKCGQRFADGWKPGDPIHADLSREHIVSSAEGTLQRLATDRLDILLLHVADTLAQPEEIAAAFDHLHQSGKVCYFGVTDYNAAQIQLLQKTLRQPLVVNQFQLGLAHPYPLIDGMEFTLQLAKGNGGADLYASTTVAGTFDYCRTHSVQIQGTSPLDITLDPSPGSEPEYTQTARLLTEIARDKATTPSAIALAWLLRHPAGIIPLLDSVSPKSLIASFEATQVSLSHDEWYLLFAAASRLQSLQWEDVSPADKSTFYGAIDCTGCAFRPKGQYLPR